MKADTATYGAAVVGERLLGLLLLPVLTRSVSPHEYGIWTQTGAVSNLLLPLVLLGLPTAIARFLAGGIAPAARRRLMLQMLAGVVAGLGVLALVVLAQPGLVAQWAYGSRADAGYTQVLLLILAGDALVDLLIAFWRAASQMRSVAGLLLVRGLLRFGLMGLALVLFESAFSAAYLLLAGLQLLLVATLYAAQALSPRIHPSGAGPAQAAPAWGELLRFGAPLVLASLLGAAHAYADRFVLTQQLGAAGVAPYAAAATLVSVGAMAYSVLGFTLFPLVARLWGAGQREDVVANIGIALRVFLFIALPVAMWLACIGDVLLPLLATAHYHVEPLVWALLGVALLGFGVYQIVLYLLLLDARGLQASGLLALAALLNIGLNLLLVPPGGLAGAALAAALSNLLLAAMAAALARLVMPMHWPWADAVRLVARAGLASGVLLAATIVLGRSGWISVIVPLLLALAVYVAADLRARESILKTQLRLLA